VNRLIYFLYYIKITPLSKFRKFLEYAAEQSGKSKQAIFWDSLYSSFKYNISILDYFYFRFYQLNHIERTQWAGTGYLYEYQLCMNPRVNRDLLENKIRFLKYFHPFIKRNYATIEDFSVNIKKIQMMMAHTSGRIVVKGSKGQVGAEVEILQTSAYNVDSLYSYMRSKGYDLAEEFVVQHPAIMELSPSGLNTLRLFTQLFNNKVAFIGASFRISVNSPVDNMAAGNLAAPVDITTGIVIGSGVYSDITKKDEVAHPVTGKKISGFQIPYWKETMEMVISAALLMPENKSIGWDIAITATGPELIEGNHNWCKLLWQLPVKKGLKPMLEKYE